MRFKLVSVDNFPGMGRGVVAREDIEQNTVIAEYELLILSTEDTKLISNTILATYTYTFNQETAQDCIALGEGSLFNHSDSPNIGYQIINKNEKSVLRISSLRKIQSGEQLFIDYGADDPSFNKKKRY